MGKVIGTALSVILFTITVFGYSYGEVGYSRDFIRAIECAISGKFAQSKAAFERELKLPPNGEFLKSSFEIFRKVNRKELERESARYAFRAMFRVKAKECDGLLSRAGEGDRAISNPEFLFSCRGLAHLINGDMEEAAADFEKSITKHPGSPAPIA